MTAIVLISFDPAAWPEQRGGMVGAVSSAGTFSRQCLLPCKAVTGCWWSWLGFASFEPSDDTAQSSLFPFLLHAMGANVLFNTSWGDALEMAQRFWGS